MSACGALENICENLPVRGLFPKKLHFCLIKVNDFRLTAAISPKRLQILESHDRLVPLAFHWHRWNELKVIPLACSPRTRRAIFFPKILFNDVHGRRLHGMLHNTELVKRKNLNPKVKTFYFYSLVKTMVFILNNWVWVFTN